MHSNLDDGKLREAMLGRLAAAGVQVPEHLVRGVLLGCLELQRMCAYLRRETIAPEQEPSNVFLIDFGLAEPNETRP